MASYHGRSISLPSRPHPIADQLEEHLCRLRSSQTASTSSSSSLTQRLVILGNLYDCVDELLLLPINQQTIARNRQTNLVDDTLDGSLKVLDIVGTARDALLQTRECIQVIQSVLRRCSGKLSLDNEIEEYLSARRKVKKAIKNCLKGIRKSDQSSEKSSVLGMLSDVEAIAVDILKSSLTHISGSEKKNSWALVSKLVHQKGNKEESTFTSEFEHFDAALSSLVSQKKKAGINMMHVDDLSQMVKLEYEIKDLDEALESLFRHLVKTRATLLNILSN